MGNQIHPSQIESTDNSPDIGEQLDSMGLRAQVNTYNDLPLEGNLIGHIRLVVSQGTYYIWQGSSPTWQPLSAHIPRGTAYPTEGLYGGYPFYRTDLEAFFTYNDQAQAWIEQ